VVEVGDDLVVVVWGVEVEELELVGVVIVCGVVEYGLYFIGFGFDFDGELDFVVVECECDFVVDWVFVFDVVDVCDLYDLFGVVWCECCFVYLVFVELELFDFLECL